MKLRNLFLYSLLIGLQGTLNSQAQNQADTSNYLANLIWDAAPVFKGVLGREKKLSSSKEKGLSTPDEIESTNKAYSDYYIASEIHNLLYRNWGMIFWDTFPNDKRKYTWLINTVQTPPTYFKDIKYGVSESRATGTKLLYAIDSIALLEWNKKYNMYRTELLNSNEVSQSDKESFIRYELYNESSNAILRAHRFGEKFDYAPWVTRFIQHLENIPVDDPHYKEWINNFVENQIIGVIRTFKNSFQMTTEDMKLYLQLIAKSRVIGLKEIVDRHLSMLALYDGKPFNFKHKTYNGKSINLDHMRGKVVLLDFWSNGCKSCIDYMPRIKPLYEKYKKKGFEVVSVNNGGPTKFKRAVEIYNKVGAGWPFVVIDNWKEYCFKYGWRGVPQLLLFNKKGKLEVYNDGLFKIEDLETNIQQLLAKD